MSLGLYVRGLVSRLDFSGWIACPYFVIWNILGNNTACTNYAILSDFDGVADNRPCSNKSVVAYFHMPFMPSNAKRLVCVKAMCEYDCAHGYVNMFSNDNFFWIKTVKDDTITNVNIRGREFYPPQVYTF